MRVFINQGLAENTEEKFCRNGAGPGNVVDVSELSTDHPMEIPGTVPQTQRHSRPKTVPPVPEYGPDNPR